MAARRAAGGRPPRMHVIDLCAGAGGKTLRARDGHGGQRAILRHRPRQAPARPDPRPARTRGRPQCAGAHALGAGGRHGRPRRPRRPCSHRCALHRHRRLAAQSGCQVARAPGALAVRLKEQAAALDRAVALVKPGGRIAYITCSVLAEENGDQIRDFLARRAMSRWSHRPKSLGRSGKYARLCRAALLSQEGLLMTPRRTGTDGFFVSVLRRT